TGWRSIGKMLEERGIKTSEKHRKDGTVYGGGNADWTIQAVRALITNPVYTGQARHGAEIVKEGAHPAIVTKAEWLAAQPKPGRSTRTDSGALLAGLLYCGTCGRKLTPSLRD